MENSLYGMGLWCTSNYNIAVCLSTTGKCLAAARPARPVLRPSGARTANWIMCAVVNIEAQWAGFCQRHWQARVGTPRELRHNQGTERLQGSRIPDERVRGHLCLQDSEEWDKIFTDLDLTHDIMAHYGDFAKNEQAFANEYAFEVSYPNGHKTTLIRPSMTSEKMGTPEFVRGPMTGEQTVEILGELGYSESEIDAMARRRRRLSD